MISLKKEKAYSMNSMKALYFEYVGNTPSINFNEYRF